MNDVLEIGKLTEEEQTQVDALIASGDPFAKWLASDFKTCRRIADKHFNEWCRADNGSKAEADEWADYQKWSSIGNQALQTIIAWLRYHNQ